jgi:translation elongation factor P/translation initiation factor 5A
MKKKASEIKQGDSIVIGGEKLIVVAVELSDIGKQGTQKCRIEATKSSGEKIVLVRPADYPIEKI